MNLVNIGTDLPKLNVVKAIQISLPFMSVAIRAVISRLAQVKGGVFILPNIDNFQKDIRVAIQTEFDKFKATQTGTEVANQKAKEVTTALTTTQSQTQVTTKTDYNAEAEKQMKEADEEIKKQKESEPEQKKNGDGLNKVPWIPIGIGGGLFDFIRNLASNPISLIALGVGGYLILSQKSKKK